MKRLFFKVVVVLVAIGMIGGCAKTCGSKLGFKQKGARFLNLQNASEPEYLDPTFISGQTETRINLALFESLVTYDPKTSLPVPSGAERWEISEDQKVYTFYLRKNAQWTDGRPVTAHDYVYAWERALNPKSGAKYAFALHYIKNAKAYNEGKGTDPQALGFRAKDDFTLEVTLEAPTPFILSLMAYSIYDPLPRWAIEKHGTRWTEPANIVSNGPFKLTVWTPYKELVFEKNEKYWGADQVKLAGIRFFPIEDYNTGLKMYETGEVDVLQDLPVQRLPALKGRPDFYQEPFLATYFYRINLKRPPFNDVRIRQALAYAIDRKGIVEKYLQGSEIPHSGYVPIGMPGYQNPAGLEFDPDKARRLLAEAGFPDGKGFPTIEIHYTTNEQYKLVCQVIQQMWKEHLGVVATLRNEEWKTFLKTQDQMNYDISQSRWIGDYIDPNTYLEMPVTNSTIMPTGWSNTDYDRLFNEAWLEKDPNKRFEILKSAEAILLNEAPVIPIFTFTRKMLIRPYVRGFYPNMIDRHALHTVSFDETALAAQ